MHPLMLALIALGAGAELTIFAGIVTALVTDPHPFRLEVFHLWMFTGLLTLLNLRIVFVGVRVWRGGGFVQITDDGVTNVKDGIGPIPWRNIKSAEIRKQPRVPRLGAHSTLFVELADGTSVAIIGSPPYQYDRLERLRDDIRKRISKSEFSNLNS